MKKNPLIICLLCFAHINSYSQVEKSSWHLKDLEQSKVNGIGLERAYEQILNKKKPKKTVIVAVIDGGVDIKHKDLKGLIWKNPNEIPFNNIDDDKNGFVDDTCGWNFLGNRKGENIGSETLELTRLHSKLMGKDSLEIFDTLKTSNEKREMYLNASKDFMAQKSESDKTIFYYRLLNDKFLNADGLVKKELKVAEYEISDLKKIKTKDKELLNAISNLRKWKILGVTPEILLEVVQDAENKHKYHLNAESNLRKKIIGDNPDNLSDTIYGNPNVKGPDSFHGTFVAGLIAAQRNNNIGAQGICNSVKIMPLRAVPDGDEADKDVALAIRYAVNKGADVINMSFGKSYSAHPEWVSEAIAYAESKGVIICHAAGNSAQDLQFGSNFPNPNVANKTWMRVGASTSKRNALMPASFSNYGTGVSIFAPGEQVFSIKPENKTETSDGTSFASPIVAGTVALIKAYYPELKAEEIVKIILESGTDFSALKVKIPSNGKRRKKAKFNTLCQSGKVLNAFKAIEKAESIISKGGN